MKKNLLMRRVLIFILGLFILASCSNKRTFTISYQMEDVKEYTPSYQLTIWLEKTDGTFVKTLFVSDYLAYGGYLEYGICPSWSKKAGWGMVTKEELDAVSGATPESGDVKMKLKFSSDEIPDGEYQLFVQVHLQGNLNETYKGEVKLISGKEINIQMKQYKIKGIENGGQKTIISDIEATIK